ncbi:GSCOCG00000788001-RA-CDS [Cotesia congregata]|nr:GSCOCG00000788001-RA-CDS [Cotesia congregata]
MMKFGLTISKLSTILKNRNKNKKLTRSLILPFSKMKKLMAKSRKYKKLEQRLLILVRELKSQGLPLDQLAFQKKTMDWYREMGPSYPFRASNSWVRHFQRTHKVKVTFQGIKNEEEEEDKVDNQSENKDEKSTVLDQEAIMNEKNEELGKEKENFFLKLFLSPKNRAVDREEKDQQEIQKDVEKKNSKEINVKIIEFLNQPIFKKNVEHFVNEDDIETRSLITGDKVSPFGIIEDKKQEKKLSAHESNKSLIKFLRNQCDFSTISDNSTKNVNDEKQVSLDVGLQTSNVLTQTKKMNKGKKINETQVEIKKVIFKSQRDQKKELDQNLLNWLSEMQSQRHEINGKKFREKALELHKSLSHTYDFGAPYSWIYSFEIQYQVKIISHRGKYKKKKHQLKNLYSSTNLLMSKKTDALSHQEIGTKDCEQDKIKNRDKEDKKILKLPCQKQGRGESISSEEKVSRKVEDDWIEEVVETAKEDDSDYMTEENFSKEQVQVNEENLATNGEEKEKNEEEVEAEEDEDEDLSSCGLIIDLDVSENSIVNETDEEKEAEEEKEVQGKNVNLAAVEVFADEIEEIEEEHVSKEQEVELGEKDLMINAEENQENTGEEEEDDGKEEEDEENIRNEVENLDAMENEENEMVIEEDEVDNLETEKNEEEIEEQHLKGKKKTSKLVTFVTDIEIINAQHSPTYCPSLELSTFKPVNKHINMKEYVKILEYKLVFSKCKQFIKDQNIRQYFKKQQIKEFNRAIDILIEKATSEDDLLDNLLMNKNWAPFGRMFCSEDIAWVCKGKIICTFCYKNDKDEYKNYSKSFINHKLTSNKKLRGRICDKCKESTVDFRPAAKCIECIIPFWRGKSFYKLHFCNEIGNLEMSSEQLLLINSILTNMHDFEY